VAVTVTFDPRVVYLVVGLLGALVYTWVASFQGEKTTGLQWFLWIIAWPVLVVSVVFSLERVRRRSLWTRQRRSGRYNPTPSPEDLGMSRR
jgi:uncharacterized membrane-anchored protein